MARKILAGILIALSAILLVGSLAGIGAIWFYNEKLTREATGRLKEIDIELGQAEARLKSSEQELERALRIVDGAQAALEKLSQKTQGAENLFGEIQSTLDDRLLPELKQTRSRIVSARTALENLQAVLNGIGSLIPGVDLNVPGKVVTDLITSARSLDTEIANVESLATQASVFVGDTGYLLGGDLSQTRESLQNFVASIQDYEVKVARWRGQAQDLIDGAPRWIDQASIGLTILLTWFALSQFGLLLHGLNLQRGGDPFLVLRRKPQDEFIAVEEEDIDLELEA
jgi:chromosome segregation ATPase